MLFLVFALALPDALLNRPYNPPAAWERVNGRCTMPVPVTRLVSGDMPAGLRISARGEMEGIPTQPGSYSFTVEISDGCARRTEQRHLRVLPAPILLADAEKLDFQCVQGAPEFSGGIIRVSSSTPGQTYTVDVLEGAWLETTLRDGAVPSTGSALEGDTVRLSIKPTKLVPGNYSARVRLSTWQGANTPELLFRLRVDTAQAILAPTILPSVLTAASPSAPAAAGGATAAPTVTPTVELASPPAVVPPPPPPRVEPPHFPAYRPSPAAPPKGPGTGVIGPIRSRILPFPKVVIKPLAKPAEGTKPEVAKPEAPPERTKPSAMPPAAAKEH